MSVTNTTLKRKFANTAAVIMGAALVSSALISSHATAQTQESNNAQQHCYPLEHGENGLGSTNSMYIPHLLTHGGWTGFFYYTNTSQKNVNIKLDLKRENGNAYVPFEVVFSSEFDHIADISALSNGGVVLKPGRTGWFAIIDNSTTEVLSGKITWQADSCLPSAVVASLRNQYADGSRIDNGHVLFNDGKPF